MKKAVKDYFIDNQYMVDLTNEERKYLGLEPLNKNYDKLVFFSSINQIYKRTTIFFNGDLIIKVICEEKDLQDYDTYVEYDTKIETINRQNILPLTSKGKIKPVNLTNVNAITPLGCVLSMGFNDWDKCYLRVVNPRSLHWLPIGCEEIIKNIKNKEELKKFIEWFVSTCPSKYLDKVEKVKNSKRKTIKYKCGDIFRADFDRNHFSYGIIIGKISDIIKWSELPESHSFRSFMTKPILIRFYDLITERDDLKAKDLEKIPLLPMKICSAGDIAWGVTPLVDHKTLTNNDVAFNFICTKIMSLNKHKTLFTDDFHISTNKTFNDYNLYIEWGFANTFIPKENVTNELKELLKDYESPYSGVWLGISPLELEFSQERFRKLPIYKYNLLNNENNHILRAIFRCLEINEDTSYDEFNKLFNGITTIDYIRKIQ